MMQAITSSGNEDNGITMSLEIRLLPPWVVSQLAQILEITHGWRKVMGGVPKDPWKTGDPIPEGLHYPRKYTSDDIHLISEECMRNHRKGFEVLVEEWGTSGRQRPTVQDLIYLLQKAKLYRAMDYMTVTVMRGERLEREESDHPVVDLDRVIDDVVRSHENVVFNTYSIDVKDDPSHAEAYNMGTVASTEETPGTSSAAEKKQSLSFDKEVLRGMDCSEAVHFPHSALKTITKNFSDVPFSSGGNRLGEGAFGIVYFAKIVQEGVEKRFAVKRLNAGESRVEEQFKTEIEVLSRCSHENLVPLEGYSCDGPEWCLVYAFMPNGSLQDCLACTGGKEPIDWLTRVLIGQGSARGIAYLHTYQERPLVHRDIKSANILLDENLTPKVGDFGLVRLGGTGTHTRTLIKTTTVFGTSAYMAPEAFRGDISVKMDTFSFGVVLLELLTGLPSYDESREEYDLLSFVQEHEGEAEELLDKGAGNWNMDVAMQLFTLAGLCTEAKKKRPTMVQTLEKYSDIVNSIS